MPVAEVRKATEADLAAIARVAIAAGQDEEWAGADPAYVSHLLAHGRLVVAVQDGGVAGFGATRRVGSGPGAVSMLCDLFVDPRAHGRGLGQAMLGVLWPDRDAPRRMTFSSLHAHALPLYTRFGLDAWWPLLYLAGDPAALGAPAGWTVATTSPGQAGDLERRWTGTDRGDDHAAWAARPSGCCVVASRGGSALAAGTVGGAGPEFGIVHLAMAPDAADPEARDAVLAVLASLAVPARRAAQSGPGAPGPGARGPGAPGGRARACLPAPHPAVRALLAAGWRNEAMDVFMATEPGLIDPRRAVPSPALA